MRTTILAVPLALLASCLSPEDETENEMEGVKHESVLHPAEMVGFLVTRDAARCRAFFVDRLGFRAVGEDEYALDVAGFEYHSGATALNKEDFEDDEVIKRVYYPESEEYLKKVTGASRVLLFDHSESLY